MAVAHSATWTCLAGTIQAGPGVSPPLLILLPGTTSCVPLLPTLPVRSRATRALLSQPV